MKKLFSLLSLTLMSFITSADDPIDRIGVKGPLQFNNIEFNLSWSQKPNSNYYIQEYVPKDESPDKFNQMLSVNVLVADFDLEDAVKAKVDELNQRKKTDKICKYKVTESPDGNEFIVDFLLSSEMNGKIDIAEFNVYRFKKIELENKKAAILVYFYTKRGYGNDVTNFLKKLSSERESHLNEMISTKMPEIKSLN